MKTDDEIEGDLEAASERIMVKCKKEILSTLRNAKTESGKPIDQEERMFILLTFLRGYTRAVAELSNAINVPLLPLMTDLVCSVAGTRNLEGLEQSIHVLLHKLEQTLPDGDLNRMGDELLNSAVLKVLGKSVKDQFGVVPTPKKGDFSVN